MKLFGSKKKKVQEPQPKKLHEMNKEELNNIKKDYNQKLRGEIR